MPQSRMARGDYCSFNKAVEHLGDRWSLLIVRDLFLSGGLGFNALADGLPGISRSVLAARLRKLQDLGIVEREGEPGPGRARGYRLTFAGRELQPLLEHLRGWAERFVPEDPAMIERDPGIVLAWLARRVDPRHGPHRRAVIEFELRGTSMPRSWFVVERGQPASICVEDPMLPAERYVFVSSDVRSIDRLARGLTSWATAVAEGSIEVAGEPSLTRSVGTWLSAATGRHALEVA
ncbi:MAG TPA: helix-turn-helix domain-containing protein [Candidatus Limnocylindrales bacterium]|nr:helix-turn-helix domain-containing protein [Candidatus Limnocylindrales bacterium]